MRNRKSIFSILVLTIILFAIGSDAISQTFSNSKTVTHSYKVTPETTVEINNKYGKIHVIPWDKDSVQITASLNVYSNNLTRLEKVKNSIDFKFTLTKYYISAFTDFGTNSNQILTELKSLSDAIITGQNQIEINYLVYCPAQINLSLVNKFGDIYIDDMIGKLKISLSNGDLKINSVEGEAQIELAFGSGIINDMREGQLTVSYSDMKIKDAMRIDIDSKSSTLNIDRADFIKIVSRRDKYFINTVENFYSNSEFSQIWIENLQCDTDCSLKYGSLTLSGIKKEFCNINLNSEYTDLNLTLSEGSKYEADIFYPDGASVNFPINKEKYGFRNEREGSIQWHASYKTAGGENLPKLRINATQKSYISIVEK
jgi:hypothetical protein